MNDSDLHLVAIKVEIDVCKDEILDSGYLHDFVASPTALDSTGHKELRRNFVKSEQLDINSENSRLVDTKQDDIKPSVFHCEVLHCQFSTKNAEDSIFHTRAHIGRKQFKCPECTHVSKRMVDLKRHMTVHSGQFPHMCAQCLFRTARVDSLKMHKTRFHSNHNAPMKCPEYTGRKKPRGNRAKYAYDINRYRYICSWEKCDKRYTKKSHLDVHLRSHIMGKGRNGKYYKCPHCVFSSNDGWYIKKHIRIRHEKVKN